MNKRAIGDLSMLPHLIVSWPQSLAAMRKITHMSVVFAIPAPANIWSVPPCCIFLKLRN